ncbi:alpha-1,3-glucanase, partial [Cantharellus anzutake]|uniref:alpha-1,3-glucanase n=1 Tax=Cantharellus anzutake TaxID=1750568 RepID=UPI001907ECD0
SYTQDLWRTNIQVAQAGGIDGFALNVGSDSWQQDRVSDAYAAAASLGTSFKLFISLDMSVIPCANAGDAALVRSYINNYAQNGNQLYYQGKQVVSTFAGENCRFGQGNLNDAWNYAVKTSVNSSIAFIPSFFVDPNTFGSLSVIDGDFNWNGGWPQGNSDITWNSDATHRSAIGNRFYMAAVSPLFFTANSYNKNWIYRSDDWLYSARWEQLFIYRRQIDIVQIISWNDYGESHYIGPIGPDQPNSQAWVNGFDHQGWVTMTNFYATGWKAGAFPTITKSQIFLSARPHSRDAVINNAAVPKPSNWQWTDDNLYATIFAAKIATLKLQIGSSNITSNIRVGVNKVSLPLSPGSPTATLVSGEADFIKFSPSGFTYTATPTAYNFNYYMAASP